MRHFQICSEENHRPELVRVVLRGEFDLASHDELLQTLRTVAADPPPERIEVDLHGVRLLDCCTIGAIITARRDAQQRGAQLYLTRVQGTAARMLALTGLSCTLTGTAPPLAT